jgi:hypothetical protein
VDAIARFSPRSVRPEAAAFAQDVVARTHPVSPARARALLFATAKLATFGLDHGLELSATVLLGPAVLERFVAGSARTMSVVTRRTVRSNLRFVARAVVPALAEPSTPLARERTKAPYSEAEMAAYFELASTQPTAARRMRGCGLLSLGAGAGLMGGDLRGVKGSDVVSRAGAVIVAVGGRRPRAVPVRARYHRVLLASAAFAQENFVIGGRNADRRTVSTPLIASLAGGEDLVALDTGRLRATWLVACAEAIGLKTFMDAAGITCSQRLGDLVSTLTPLDEAAAAALLGGAS